MILTKIWLIIVLSTNNGSSYSYHLNNPEKLLNIHLETKDKLPYKDNSWIRMTGTIKCEIVKEIPCNNCIPELHYFCTSKDLKESKCEVKETFIVGGIGYC